MDEPGAFVGKINPKNPARQYLGYVDKDASEKKVVKDVFTHGDAAFISGKSYYFFHQILIILCCSKRKY